MHVIRHHARHIQLVLQLLMSVARAPQYNGSLLRSKNAPLVSGECDGVLCPRSFEMRESSLSVADFLWAFRRGAGKSTRGACAPRRCFGSFFFCDLVHRLKRETNELHRNGGFNAFIPDDKFCCAVRSRCGGRGGSACCALLSRASFLLFVADGERANDKKLPIGARDLIQYLAQR